jgi:hypothetical protein
MFGLFVCFILEVRVGDVGNFLRQFLDDIFFVDEGTEPVIGPGTLNDIQVRQMRKQVFNVTRQPSTDAKAVAVVLVFNNGQDRMFGKNPHEGAPFSS